MGGFRSDGFHQGLVRFNQNWDFKVSLKKLSIIGSKSKCFFFLSNKTNRISQANLSRYSVLRCDKLMNIIRDNYKTTTPKYKYRRHPKIGHHSHFVMLMTKLSKAKFYLEELLRRPKLFNCINDDLDRKYGKANEYEAIVGLLNEFYITLFPNRSEFELDHSATNQFRYLNEYQEWEQAKINNRYLGIVVVGNVWLACLFYRIGDIFNVI